MTKIYFVFCFYLFQINIYASTLDSLIFIDVDEVLRDLKKNDTLSKYYDYEIYDSITDLDKTTISKLLNVQLFFDDKTIKEKLLGQRKYPRKHIQFFKTNITSLKEIILNNTLLINILDAGEFYMEPKIFIRGNKMSLISIYGGHGEDSWRHTYKIIKKGHKLKIYMIFAIVS